MFTDHIVTFKLEAVQLTYNNRVEVVEWLSTLTNTFYHFTDTETLISFFNKYGIKSDVAENDYIFINKASGLIYSSQDGFKNLPYSITEV